jgi:hypothetical protein
MTVLSTQNTAPPNKTLRGTGFEQPNGTPNNAGNFQGGTLPRNWGALIIIRKGFRVLRFGGIADGRRVAQLPDFCAKRHVSSTFTLADVALHNTVQDAQRVANAGAFTCVCF